MRKVARDRSSKRQAYSIEAWPSRDEPFQGATTITPVCGKRESYDRELPAVAKVVSCILASLNNDAQLNLHSTTT